MAVHSRDRNRLGVLGELLSSRFAVVLEDGNRAWFPIATLAGSRRGRAAVSFKYHQAALFALPGMPEPLPPALPPLLVRPGYPRPRIRQRSTSEM